MISFNFSNLIYLKVRETEDKGLPFTGSLPESPEQPGLGQANQEAGTRFVSPTVVTGIYI